MAAAASDPLAHPDGSPGQVSPGLRRLLRRATASRSRCQEGSRAIREAKEAAHTLRPERCLLPCQITDTQRGLLSRRRASPASLVQERRLVRKCAETREEAQRPGPAVARKGLFPTCRPRPAARCHCRRAKGQATTTQQRRGCRTKGSTGTFIARRTLHATLHARRRFDALVRSTCRKLAPRY